MFPTEAPREIPSAVPPRTIVSCLRIEIRTSNLNSVSSFETDLRSDPSIRLTMAHWDHGILSLFYPQDHFWEEYAADRRRLLYSGVDSNGQPMETKYLIYIPPTGGLGNHIVGMLSSFVLSIAFERVFLHEWTEGTPRYAVVSDLPCAQGSFDNSTPNSVQK